MRTIDEGSKSLADELNSRDTSSIGLRQAKIVSVDGSGDSTIELEGSPIPQVKALNSYDPQVEDSVWVIQDIPDYLILGKIGQIDGPGNGGTVALDSHSSSTTSTNFQTVINTSGPGKIVGGVIQPSGTSAQIRFTVDGEDSETFDVSSNNVMGMPNIEYSSSLHIEIRLTSSFGSAISCQVWIRS